MTGPGPPRYAVPRRPRASRRPAPRSRDGRHTVSGAPAPPGTSFSRGRGPALRRPGGRRRRRGFVPDRCVSCVAGRAESCRPRSWASATGHGGSARAGTVRDTPPCSGPVPPGRCQDRGHGRAEALRRGGGGDGLDLVRRGREIRVLPAARGDDAVHVSPTAAHRGAAGSPADARTGSGWRSPDPRTSGSSYTGAPASTRSRSARRKSARTARGPDCLPCVPRSARTTTPDGPPSSPASARAAPPAVRLT